MGRMLKKTLRFGAFISLVSLVFFTNILHKLGFTPSGSKDDGKNLNDLFAPFSNIPTAHADTPVYYGDSGPNCDSGPCPGPGPH